MGENGDLGEFLSKHEAPAVCELLGEVASLVARSHKDNIPTFFDSEPQDADDKASELDKDVESE